MPAKKTTKAKTATKRKPTTTARKAPVKKTVAKPRSKKSTKPVAVKSFRLEPETEPFMATRFTAQTAYWLVLGIFVVAFSVWISYLNAQIQDLYDIVDQNISMSSDLTTQQLEKSLHAKSQVAAKSN